MRFIVPVAVLFASLPLTSSWAGTDQEPLAAGKPAGVQKAQTEEGVGTILFGAGLLAAGIAIATTGGNGNKTTTTTTTTGTSP